MANKSEYAFPSNNAKGVTTRDYFACGALSLMRPIMQKGTTPKQISAYAYAIADAMMEHREL